MKMVMPLFISLLKFIVTGWLVYSTNVYSTDVYSIDAVVDDHESIEWLAAEFPPFTITSGEYTGKGYGDVIYQRLLNRLDDVLHTRKIVNMGHARSGVKVFQNACAYDLLKTPEREAFMVFSKPLYYVLPVGLLTLDQKNVKSLINENGYFELVKMKQHPSFILGLASNRSYGKVIDKLLSQIDYGEHTASTANNLMPEQYAMMKMQRIDGSLGYPTEAFYLSTVHRGIIAHGIADKEIFYYPIDKQTPLLAGYVGCNKGAIGQRIIELIDNRWDQEDTEQVTQTYHRWLSQSSVELHQRLLVEQQALANSALPL